MASMHSRGDLQGGGTPLCSCNKGFSPAGGTLFGSSLSGIRKESQVTSLPLLIVEDDRDLRDALCITLELAGYAVIPAADGSAALAAMRRQRVGLVGSDIQMQPPG